MAKLAHGDALVDETKATSKATPATLRVARAVIDGMKQPLRGFLRARQSGGASPVARW